MHPSDPNHPLKPRRLLALLRRRQAFQMKLAGASEYEIAKTLGVTQGAVSKMLWVAVDELKATDGMDTERYREIVRRHIFRALAALEPSLLSTDKGEMFAATDRIVRQCERLARLEGLDAPERKDFTSEGKAIRVVGVDLTKFTNEEKPE